MKKYVILIDSDDFLLISKIKKEWLKDELTIIPKDIIEIFSIDEEGNGRK